MRAATVSLWNRTLMFLPFLPPCDILTSLLVDTQIFFSVYPPAQGMLATILGRWVGYTVSFRAVDFTLLKCSWLKAIVLSTKVTVSVAVVLCY